MYESALSLTRIVSCEGTSAAALLLDELASDFGSTESRVKARGAKRGISLALLLNDRLDILQEMRQVVFSRFTTSGRDVILDRLASLKFSGGFADGAAIPAQFALGQALAASPESFYDFGHEQASGAAFEILGGVDEEGFHLVVEFHRRRIGCSKNESSTPNGQLFSCNGIS